MKRLTTDSPKSNFTTALNLFYATEDKMVNVRGYGPDSTDISLLDLIRKLSTGYNLDIDPSLDDDDLMETMDGLLFDGIDTPEGVAALLYTAGWAFAELRGCLKRYEDADATLEGTFDA